MPDIASHVHTCLCSNRQRTPRTSPSSVARVTVHTWSEQQPDAAGGAEGGAGGDAGEIANRHLPHCHQSGIGRSQVYKQMVIHNAAS